MFHFQSLPVGDAVQLLYESNLRFMAARFSLHVSAFMHDWSEIDVFGNIFVCVASRVCVRAIVFTGRLSVSFKEVVN